MARRVIMPGPRSLFSFPAEYCAVFYHLGLSPPSVRDSVLDRQSLARYAAGGGETTTALPTISTSESPGIQSTAMYARDGALPGLK